VIAPRIGSLFSGYAGLDIGLRNVVGGSTAWFSEYDDAPSRVLAHHWPNTPNLGDVTLIDWAQVEPVEILTGGYPCQPFSLIGNRKGTDDARHLWPHFAAAIRSLRPKLAILENVRGHLSLGLDTVLRDLAGLGYDAEWVCVRASDVGAPHQRERLFAVAYPADESGRFRHRDDLQAWRTARRQPQDARAGLAADADDLGGDWDWGTRSRWDESKNVRVEDAVWARSLGRIREWESITGRYAPWPGRVLGGVTTEFSEWMMGMPAGHVTGSEIGLTRDQQAHVIGNGVVPQQASYALDILFDRLAA
jgi:DNA (cytosine-5)-methyltransferase 1